MAPAVVSAAVHGIVIGTLIAVPLMLVTSTLPPVPTMMAFVAAVPAPPPPPPPPPKRAESSPARPVATAGRNAAPVDAPAAVQPEPAGVMGDEGVEGGVEGGLIGGMVGGIVGGLLAEAPPTLPPPPPLPPRGPIRIGGKITAPALVHRVEPRYPDFAVAAKIGGTVILEATVGADGEVDDIRVLRSVRFLDQAAIEAVKQWRYSPLVLNGVATPFILTVTLSFRIPH
jgi:protein TonB